MYTYEKVPTQWFHPNQYSRPAPMSRPVSKNFNRISDFIFPDTIHIQYPVQYHRTDNYSLPILNRRDLVIVEHLPADQITNTDLLYREQHYQPNRSIRRRYTSIVDERRMPSKNLANRSASYRERVRDRRKRHTIDNAYPSMSKTTSDKNEHNPNYILSYRTTLEPISDSESMTSLHDQIRVPINGTTISREYFRQQQRHDSSSISSRDSSTDTEIIQQRSFDQSDRFIPIKQTLNTDTNSRINSSPFDNIINDQITNRTSAHESMAHHVSLCVNDLRTTLFIDEETLNTSPTNNKAIVKTFIDRIIKRLQHFKRSLDNGLIHIRKRNSLVNGSIISADNNDSKFVRPYFLIQPQTILLLPNETAKFKCCFGGDPYPNLTWFHNEHPISSKSQLNKLHDIHYLNIGPVNLDDNGEIKCVIANKIAREEVKVRLLVVPSPADGMPLITQTLSDITTTEGQPLKLSCEINGLQVIVNWFHNGKLISPTDQLKSDYHHETVVFTLSCCTKTDAGTIDCLVKNRFGEARTSCRIDVINDDEFDR